jgi:predicted nucleic acid-binding protein
VAAKWALRETGEQLVVEALELLDQYGEGKIEFLVPDLFWIELGNVLWKAVRLRRCTRAVAENGMAEMRQRKLPTVSSTTLIEQALEIAITFDRTVFDCVYIALALESRTQLITADARLAKATAIHLPVKWLGAI